MNKTFAGLLVVLALFTVSAARGDSAPLSPALDRALRQAAGGGFEVCRYGVWYLPQAKWFFDCPSSKLPYSTGADSGSHADIDFFDLSYCVQGDVNAAKVYLGFLASALVEMKALNSFDSVGWNSAHRPVLNVTYPDHECRAWKDEGPNTVDGSEQMVCTDDVIVSTSVSITYQDCDAVRAETP